MVLKRNGITAPSPHGQSVADALHTCTPDSDMEPSPLGWPCTPWECAADEGAVPSGLVAHDADAAALRLITSNRRMGRCKRALPGRAGSSDTRLLLTLAVAVGAELGGGGGGLL